jgi:pimeloyl-ACP methyl ester carboxylesterase
MIILPAPATVLYLRGMGASTNRMTGWCGGIFDHAPYTPKTVDYPADSSATSISTGIDMFNAAVRAEDSVICVAHSQGCQVASAWMNKFGDDPTAPGSDRLQFVLTGNPLRYPTGKGIGLPEFGGTIGRATPIDAPWRVIDVARAKDGWAIKGPVFSAQWWGQFFVHPNYRNVNLFEPLSITYIGNTISLVVS